MAVLTVGGAAIPTPSELKVSIFEVGSGGTRSASGKLVSDVVAVKRRLNLRWAHMTPVELGDLLGAVSGAFFEATYPDPVAAQARAAVFRAGESTVGVLRIQGGEPVWTDVSMEWIER